MAQRRGAVDWTVSPACYGNELSVSIDDEEPVQNTVSIWPPYVRALTFSSGGTGAFYSPGVVESADYRTVLRVRGRLFSHTWLSGVDPEEHVRWYERWRLTTYMAEPISSGGIPIAAPPPASYQLEQAPVANESFLWEHVEKHYIPFDPGTAFGNLVALFGTEGSTHAFTTRVNIDVRVKRTLEPNEHLMFVYQLDTPNTLDPGTGISGLTDVWCRVLAQAER